MSKARLTIFPLGNADTLRIDLVDGRKILMDYANMRNSDDLSDKRCDLPAELRAELEEAVRDNYDAVCFTHLDDDHVKGASDFFWFDHAAAYQSEDRIKIKELWVPAAAVTEEGSTGCARVIRQEARYRLKKGYGIRVFSRPDALKALLESWGLTLESRAHLIVDAGKLVPGYSKLGAERAEFFVHSPFAWRLNDREVEDRNQDAIVLQATFVEGGAETYALLGSDVNHETLSQIVQTTKRKKNEARLLWDVMKLPHHCSYLSLGPDRGENETKAVPDVKWLFETQARGQCIILSPSWPIPIAGSDEDDDVQPPHRQAANHHRRIAREKDGEFKVTMETPSQARPKPIVVEITAYGVTILLATTTAVGVLASTPARAGRAG